MIGLFLLVAVLGSIFAAVSLIRGGEEERVGPATVKVIKGDTLSSVAEKLERAEIIDSAFMFKLQARVDGYGTEIKTGEYTFARGTESRTILEELTAGEAIPTLQITVPEGLSLKETAAEVAAQSAVSASEFEKAAGRTDYGYGFLEDRSIKSTEGFLFPKQYEFEEGTEAPQMVTRMLEQYLLETQALDIPGAKDRLNLSEQELVTVASLIEKEAALPEERPLVASVIYNRLRKDMPLQIDASVHYALDKQGEELSLADLEVNSPYNTYETEGLPPGPICSPGRASLEAAMNPADSDYLYYVLKASGEEHVFTSSYREFLDAKDKAGR